MQHGGTRMKYRATGGAGFPTHKSFDTTRVPSEVWAQILALLPLNQRLPLATVSHTWCEAVRLTIRGVTVDLRERSRAAQCRQLDSWVLVATLAVASPASCGSGSAAAAASQACCWEPTEQKLWQPAAGKLRPAAAAWHLRRAVSALLTGQGRPVHPHQQRPGRRSLTLLLAAPEMDTSTSDLQRMLATAGAEDLFTAVSMPQGLLRLDGCLARQLAWCNTPASCLPAALQGRASYTRLERLVLKLSPSDDLPAILGCIDVQGLPALRILALLASASAGVAADLAALTHGGLRQLDMQGVQLPAGFAGLQQLTGLRTLAVRYDEEDETPPLNLAPNDLAALSTLKQLSALALDNLACDEGLAALTHLTSLSLTPQQGARIAVKGLPLLRRLAVDLSAGSCGRDLLSAARSSVHVPAAGHGLGSLQQLELRCFVWRHWDAAGSEGGDDGSNGGGNGSSTDSDSGSEQPDAAGSEGADSDGGSEGGEAGSGSELGSGSEVGSEESGGVGGSEADSGSSEAGSDAASGSAASMSEAADSNMEGGSEAGFGAGSEAEEMQAEEAADDGVDDGEEEDADVEPQQAGLLEASWGWLHPHDAAADGGGGGSEVHALASLEQRYIASLLARLPTLASIQLTDYMGLVDPPTLLAAPHTGKPGLAAPMLGVGVTTGGGGASGSKEAGGLGGSRAGTPGLLVQQGGTGGGGGGAAWAAASSSLSGWQRAVAETPVPGGMSQYDLTYTLTG